MADTSSTIRIVFDGTAKGVITAAKSAQAAIRGLNDDSSKLAKAADKTTSGLLSISKGFAALGTAGGAVQTVGAVAGALTQLAPAALLLPGALLGGAAAMGTFKIATAGMGDALKAGLSGDLEKFAEATKEMAPEMQNAAKAIVAFKPQVDGLKKTVQGNFWSQFSGDIAKVGGDYLPIMTTGLGDIATQLGTVAKGALAATQTPFFKGAVTSILNSTASAMREVGAGAGDALTGFIGIGQVGARYLPQLGEAVGGITLRFREWVEANSQAGGAIEKLIDGAITGFTDLLGIVKNVGSILGSVFTGLGGSISSPLASLRELTGAVAEFLKTAEAQDGLKALGETLRVIGEQVGRVVLTALRELAPTLVDIAPAAQAFARGLGDFLVGALQVLGPLLRTVAQELSEHQSLIQALVPVVGALVIGVKGLIVFNQVRGWVSGAQVALSAFGVAATGAGTKAGTLVTKLGGLKTLGLAAALGAIAVGIDKINTSAAGGEQNLQGFEENLNDISRLLSGDWGNPFQDINSQLDQTRRNIQSGESAFGQFLGTIKRSLAEKLPPLTFDVNTGPAAAQIDGFIAGVNRNSPTVNINGNTNGAAFALREILREIAAGKSEVIIDGQPVPAQEALQFVLGLINNSNPMVDINGNPTPAGDALAGFLKQAQGSTATANLNANPGLAYETVGGWTRAAEGTVGVAKLNANPAQALQVTAAWKSVSAATTGVAKLDANPAGANQQLGGWQGRANAATGTSKLNANPAQANGVTSGWVGDANRSVGTAKLNANDSGARTTLGGLLRDWGSRVLTWTVRTITGVAEGGPVFSGAVRGPGTGTSDTAGLFALSNGEHVLTARDVQLLGGQGAVLAMRRALHGGRIPRMTATRGRAATGGSPAGALSVPTPQVSVAVHIGSQEITDIVRSEISHNSRQTRRTVLAGAGNTF